MTVRRVAVVIDSSPVCRYVDDLLGAIEQCEQLFFTVLVLRDQSYGWRDPVARRMRVGGAARARLSESLVGFEFWCLRILKSLRPGLARRAGFRDASPRDVRSRFRQVIELAPDADLAFETPVDLVLVLGPWLPGAVLAQCPPAATVLQVELGGYPEQGLALAGFEECHAGSDSTPVRFYGVNVADGSRELLVDGHNRTKRLLSLNQVAVWDRALSLLRSHLLTTGVPVSARAASRDRPADAPDSSPMGRLLAYPLRSLGRGVRLAVQQLRGRRRWSVAICRRVAADQGLNAPAWVEPAPAGTYQADPILYRDPYTGVAYCFVEEVDESINRGHIAVLRESGGSWHRAGVALKEPFHLSFPFLFRFNGRVYMCPEAGASGEIRVYRCTDFPLQWELEVVLMRGVSAADTVLVPQHDQWWMLTNLDRADRPDHQSELHLFYADSPLSTEWRPVGGNPIKADCRGGRNGGMEVADGQIYRFGQVQSFDAYGARLNRYQITRLGVDGYEEVLCEAVRSPPGIGSTGIHTYSSIDGWVAVDLLEAKANGSV